MQYKTWKPSFCWGHKESGTQSGKQREENRRRLHSVFLCKRIYFNRNVLVTASRTVAIHPWKLVFLDVDYYELWRFIYNSLYFVWCFCGISFGVFVVFCLVFLWHFIWCFCGILFGVFVVFCLVFLWHFILFSFPYFWNIKFSEIKERASYISDNNK